MAETDPSSTEDSSIDAAMVSLAGEHPLPEFCITWKNATKTSWKTTRGHASFSNHPQLIKYVKRPRGELRFQDLANNGTMDSMEFNVDHNGIPKPFPAQLEVNSQYRSIAPSGKVFFEVRFLIAASVVGDGYMFNWEFRSSEKPQWLNNASMIQFAGSEKEGYYVCHAQQVGNNVKAHRLDIHVLIRPRLPQEPWPPSPALMSTAEPAVSASDVVSEAANSIKP